MELRVLRVIGAINLLCILLSSVVSGQPFTAIFEYISTDNGLPQNHVFHITRDSDGFMWNGGVSWENMSGTLPNTPINTIILDDAAEYAVYIGTDIGVFYLDSNLNDWVHFSNGFPIVEVADLDINFAENKILACTYGRGIWWGDLYSVCEDVIVVTPVMQHLNLSHFFQASDSVLSNVPVDNSFGIQVQYRSGNVVQLTEGFRATAQYGSLFRALNGECGDGGVPSVPLVVPTETLPAIQTEIQSMTKRIN